MKRTLIETNKYLRDPKTLDSILKENVRQSSALEGARLGSKTSNDTDQSKKRRIASSNNSANG